MKKRLPKAIIGMTAAVMFLTACQANTNEPTGAAPQPADAGEPQVVELTVSHNMDFVTIPNSIIAAGERLNAKYEAEGRNTKVVFKQDYHTIDWTEYHNKIVFAHKSNDAPDIFHMTGDLPGLVEAGAVLEVNDLVLPEFVESAFTPFQYEGNTYGIPVDLPVRVLYYNKGVLSQLGWTDEEIDELPERIKNGDFTFEQFMAVAEQSVQQGAATWGMTHRPGQGSDFMEILNVLGGQYYTEDGQLVFDEAGLLRTYEFFYKNAVETKITPPNSNQMGWDTINRLVGSGEAFSYYGPLFSSTYVAGSVNKSPEELANDVSFVLFPVSAFNDAPFAVAAPTAVAISKQTKHPEIVKDLFRELATDSSDLLANHAATIFALSSVKSANEDPLVTEHPVLKDVSYMTEYSRIVPTVSGLSFYLSEFFKQLQLIELGSTTPEKAVQDFKVQVELNVDDVIFK